MSLTSRLCAFFLVALATVLAGFSFILLILAGFYLDRQLEARSTSALDILSAGVEMADNGLLEWEPNDRFMAIGRDPVDHEIRWRVTHDDGRVIDGSREPVRISSEYRVKSRSIGSSPGGLSLTVAVPRSPGNEAWKILLLTVLLLSLGVWSICAMISRRVCRRALGPLLKMTLESRAMSADDPAQRLTDPQTMDELSELACEFNHLLTRRQEAFERQSRFTGNASHQLRTPVAAMLGQIEVALRRERDPREYQRVLKLVGERAVHLRRIVDLMLFLARADADALAPELDLIELGAWLDETMARHVTHARSCDFALGISCLSPMIVRASVVMLDELLDILLDNAAKHSQPGTGIGLMLTCDDSNHVRFSISDQGLGMASTELTQLFEPFHRGQESRRLGLPGVGLGLSVAKRITQALRAEIEVESRQGVGTTFHVLFPQLVESQVIAPTEVSMTL